MHGRVLRDFVGERAFVELAGGFAVAVATVAVLNALVEFALRAAWPEPELAEIGDQPYTAHVGRHVLYYEQPLAALLTLALVFVLLYAVVRRVGLRSWSGGELRECPYCLNTVAARASACEFCTRHLSPSS